MTPLIDVCLVLLVFFIMTATVAALQTRLDAPTVSNEKTKVAVVTEKEVAEQMIVVKATMEDGEPVIRVEGDVVDLNKLLRELIGYRKSSGKTTLLLEHDDEVPQDTVVQILDRAKEADIHRVRLLVP
jgi:biopolymer transport protein ExbD